MTKETTTKNEFVLNGMKIIYFDSFYDLNLPHVRVFEPHQTDSGGWEAWSAIDPQKEHKLIELYTEDDGMGPEQFYHVLAGLEVGFSSGLISGRSEVQSSIKVALGLGDNPDL